MNACDRFRSRLASLLSGRASSASTDPQVGFDSRAPFDQLGWHEHLLSCAECRELLQAEEALDVLLSSMPQPHLPPELARRVLAKLEPARADLELDRLLDSSLEAPVPSDLARSVLRKLAAARSAQESEEPALDALLARLPEPEVPASLAARVLAGLAHERDLARRAHTRASVAHARPLPGRAVGSGAVGTGAVGSQASAARAAVSVQRAARPVTLQRRRILIAATILLAFGAGTWIWSLVRQGPQRVPSTSADSLVDSTPIQPRTSEPRALEAPYLDGTRPSLEEPPDELLASLDLLESWDLLTDDSIEAELVLEGYEALLLGDENGAAPAESPNEGEKPSKG
ncbi:MAG: hypothetical protein IT454_00120 [Planctomycetes bacterium]|nr:hypothetical protein [Planctomycetota bacterium]